MSEDDPVERPQEPGRPGKKLVVACVAVAALVVAGALLVPQAISLATGPPPDLSAVRTYDITDRRHTEEDVAYPTRPSAGGPHDPVWLECGRYDEPVREENLTHDLEHGTVWIAHHPSLDESEVDELAELLPDNGILSPYDGLSSPVVVTVWGAQLSLAEADDPRLELFLAEYGDGHTAPELGVTCHGGTTDPGGEPEEPGVSV